jgi:non-heme chloroperoxidase
MNPAATRRFLIASTTGLQLQVTERGDPASPGILFIHGYGQSHLSFHRQFEADILSSFHLVAFDLRGHGGSDKPREESAYQASIAWARDVAAVLEATQLTQPAIVGWSYGGYVAADYVRHYGVANVGALNMVGSSAGLIDTRTPSAEGTPRSLIPGDILDLSELIRLGKDAARQFACPEMTNDERELLFATEMMMPNYVRASILRRDLNNADIRHRFTIPMLISVGSDDGFITPSKADILASSLPSAQVSVYEGVGHLPFMQCPSRFDAELRQLASPQ